MMLMIATTTPGVAPRTTSATMIARKLPETLMPCAPELTTLASLATARVRRMSSDGKSQFATGAIQTESPSADDAPDDLESPGSLLVGRLGHLALPLRRGVRRGRLGGELDSRRLAHRVDEPVEVDDLVAALAARACGRTGPGRDRTSCGARPRSRRGTWRLRPRSSVVWCRYLPFAFLGRSGAEKRPKLQTAWEGLGAFAQSGKTRPDPIPRSAQVQARKTYASCTGLGNSGASSPGVRRVLPERRAR